MKMAKAITMKLLFTSLLISMFFASQVFAGAVPQTKKTANTGAAKALAPKAGKTASKPVAPKPASSKPAAPATTSPLKLQTPVPAKETPPQNVQNVDTAELLKSIDEHISVVDQLISQFAAAKRPEDVKKLEDIRRSFGEHRTKINSSSAGTAIAGYAGDSRALFDDLNKIKARADVPARFNDLFLALKKLKESNSAGWAALGLDGFFERLKQENEAIGQMQLPEKMEDGPDVVRWFMEENRETIWKVMSGSEGILSGVEEPVVSVRDAIIQTSAATNSFIYGANPGEIPLVEDPHPRVKPVAKALVIIVDSWFWNFDGFRNNQGKINLDVVKNIWIPVLLKRVAWSYSRMSYGKFTWDFGDICDVAGDKVRMPGAYDNVALFTAAIGLCEADPNFKKDISQYDAIIVFPAAVKTKEAPKALGDTNFYTLASPRLGEQKIYNFSGIRITVEDDFGVNKAYPMNAFKVETIGHELGHSLGLPHGDLYHCGSHTYHKDCNLMSFDNNQGNMEYYDYWDIMGAFDYYEYFPYDDVGLNTNCYYKEARNWMSARHMDSKKRGSYPISALESQSPDEAAKCWVLDVDTLQYTDKDTPCDHIYIESRMPRKAANGKVYGGMVLHCENRALREYVAPLIDRQTELLRCSPFADNWLEQTLVRSGDACDTNLGYLIFFQTLDERSGTVTVIPECEDRDNDGYFDQLDASECYISSDREHVNPDCNDSDWSVNPDAKEVCDGADNNCDDLVDEVLMNPGGNNLETPGMGVCGKCEDDDANGYVGGEGNNNNIMYWGYDPFKMGTIKATLPYGGSFGPEKEICKDGKTLIEQYCLSNDHGHSSRPVTADVSCRSLGEKMCRDGACVPAPKCNDHGGCQVFEDPPDCVPFLPQCCADRDGDGFESPIDPQNCKLRTQADCDDGNNAIKPGAPEVCGDHKDNNCISGADEGCAVPCRDDDGDKWYVAAGNCTPPAGAKGPGDCNDGNANFNHDAKGVCNCNSYNPQAYTPNADACDRLDNNCDGKTDPNCWYCADSDGGPRYDQYGIDIEYQIPGIVTYEKYDANGTYSKYTYGDYCLTAYLIVEYICDAEYGVVPLQADCRQVMYGGGYRQPVCLYAPAKCL